MTKIPNGYRPFKCTFQETLDMEECTNDSSKGVVYLCNACLAIICAPHVTRHDEMKHDWRHESWSNMKKKNDLI